MLQRSHALSLIAAAALAITPLGCGDSGTTGTGGGTTSQGGGTTSQGGGTTSQGGGGSTSSFGGGTTSQGGGGGTTSQGGMGGMATGGMGGMGTGGEGGGTSNPTASTQIETVLGTADGGTLTLPIQGAFVTYVKPAVGADVAGFFLQGEQMGPAIFVAVDPATLTPVPAVGDAVSLTVTDVATSTGLKEITGLSGFSVTSSGHDIAPLVTDIGAQTDILTNLDGYTSRVVTFDADIVGDFVSAGAPQVAAPIATTGLTDPNFRLRMPESVRAAYDLQNGCSVAIDYGVMWRFNAVAQPSALNAADIVTAVCPDPTVASAIAGSSTSVVVTFDRALDPATVQASDFTFSGGLTASAVVVSADGKTVTLTTTAQTSGTSYTVTVANLTDVLGASLGMPNSATFTGFVVAAGLIINEMSPLITGSHDLIELLVTSAGTVNGTTIIEDGTNLTTLATLPDVMVAQGDLIVVHLTPTGTTGIAPASETASKTEFPNSPYSANYDGAWDFLGTANPITNNNRIIRVEAPGGVLLDLVPGIITTGTPPGAFPLDLQAAQALGDWLPADCAGVPCTYATTPSALDISVPYTGCGSSPTGNTIARKPGMNTKQKSDWNAAAAQSLGLVNP